MRNVLARLAVGLLLVVAAVSTPAAPAHAAPPTRVVDEIVDVACTGVSQEVKITVGAARSELAGTVSSVQLSIPGRGTIGGGESTSNWGEDTFRAVIPVLDLEEQPAGEVSFSGTYILAGEPATTRDARKVGNVRVVEERTRTPLALSNVTLTYRDSDNSPGDLTYADLACDGFLLEASLFFTNPASLVEFSSQLFFFPEDCNNTNVSEGFAIEATGGTTDELFVSLVYADRPEAQASGLVTPDGGTWQGELRLQISDEPAGTVTAAATLERGRPFHATEPDTGMRNHFQVTPYNFTLETEGPGAPAVLDCTFFRVRQKTHVPNPSP